MLLNGALMRLIAARRLNPNTGELTAQSSLKVKPTAHRTRKLIFETQGRCAMVKDCGIWKTHLGEAGGDSVEVHALRSVGAVAPQAPVPDPVSGQQVPGPLMAPAAEGQEALVLKHLCFHHPWPKHQTAIKMLPRGDMHENDVVGHLSDSMLWQDVPTSFATARRGREREKKEGRSPLSSAACCEEVWLVKDSALGPRELSSTALACRAWSHCLTFHRPAWSHSLSYACTSTEN